MAARLRAAAARSAVRSELEPRDVPRRTCGGRRRRVGKCGGWRRRAGERTGAGRRARGCGASPRRPVGRCGELAGHARGGEAVQCAAAWWRRAGVLWRALSGWPAVLRGIVRQASHPPGHPARTRAPSAHRVAPSRREALAHRDFLSHLPNSAFAVAEAKGALSGREARRAAASARYGAPTSAAATRPARHAPCRTQRRARWEQAPSCSVADHHMPLAVELYTLYGLEQRLRVRELEGVVLYRMLMWVPDLGLASRVCPGMAP
eukprot:3308898-Prymnesium_polylepis.2